MSVQETNSSFERARDAIGEVGAFWFTEWRSLAASGKARLAPGSVALTTVLFGATDIVVTRPEGSGSTIQPRGDSDGRSPIAILANDLAGESSVAVVLPTDDVLRPVLRLPRASKSVMRNALQFELPRFIPLPADQLYFDFKTYPATADPSEADYRLRVVRKSTVDAAMAKCHAAGVAVAQIGFAGDPNPADWRTFPVDRRAYILAQALRWSLAGLLGVATLLAALLLIAIYSRGQATLAALGQQIEAARVSAAVSQHLRANIETLGRQRSFLVAAKQKPLLIATLAELSELLPSDTWITNFQVNGRKVRIEGSSPSAARLIGLIDSSKLFTNAQFEAPLTRDTENKSERFDLTFVVGR